MSLPVENVWDYPRPPRLERVELPLIVQFAGEVIADAPGGWRVLETSHPPTYYLVADHVDMSVLSRSVQSSFCEFKGAAVYWSITVGEQTSRNAAWSYPDPSPGFAEIKDCLSFYASRMERCVVAGEVVAAQPGDFYGGWVTENLRGPFKGGPGTAGW